MIEQKSWFQSKTIWGALMTVIAVVLGQLGISLDLAIQHQLIDLIMNGLTLLGSAIAIYGRLRATTLLKK